MMDGQWIVCGAAPPGPADPWIISDTATGSLAPEGPMPG